MLNSEELQSIVDKFQTDLIFANRLGEEELNAFFPIIV